MHLERHATEWSWIQLSAAVLLVVGLTAAPAHGQSSAPAATDQQGGERVQRASGAGTWYPGDPDRLRDAVDGYLSTDPQVVPGKPAALIAPHAGYDYSGPVAGTTYSTLRGHTYKRVLVLGFSHRMPLRGASVLGVDVFETPLGRIPVDTEARDMLLGNPVVTEQPLAHRNEHSAENQLPMLQRALGDFQVVEVLVGQLTETQRHTLAEAIRTLWDEETLIVVSSDFTHYGPNFGYTPFRDRLPERLLALNDAAVQEILEVDVPGWDAFLHNTRATICGRDPVALLLTALQPIEDVQGRRMAYATSGQLTGDWTNSVTYAGIVFWRTGDGLTEAEQHTLLHIARNTVTDFLEQRTVPTLDATQYDLTPGLTNFGAAFVTLRNGGQLRGCIGHIVAVDPLFISVAQNAYHASLDPRFQNNPVTIREVEDLHIEVSVLTPMRRLLDPHEVRVGTDGLLIVRGRNRGVLLPQVPIEQGWNREQFLDQACVKAGLPVNAWMDSQTEIYRFSAQVFGEEDHRER